MWTKRGFFLGSDLIWEWSRPKSLPKNAVDFSWSSHTRRLFITCVRHRGDLTRWTDLSTYSAYRTPTLSRLQPVQNAAAIDFLLRYEKETVFQRSRRLYAGFRSPIGSIWICSLFVFKELNWISLPLSFSDLAFLLSEFHSSDYCFSSNYKRRVFRSIKQQRCYSQSVNVGTFAAPLRVALLKNEPTVMECEI